MLLGASKLIRSLIIGFVLVGGGSLWLRGIIFPREVREVVPSSVMMSPGTLALYYHHRPPYYHETAAGLEGLVVDPVVAAMEAAEIDYYWVSMSAPRQLETIRRNESPVGAIGWFLNEERTNFASFSDPIYRDEPLVAVTRKDNAAITGDVTLESLLRDKSQTLLVKESYSYGEALDRAIQLFEPPIEKTASDNTGMLLMILAGRADYTFIAPEEVRHIMARNSEGDSELRIFDLAEMPPGSMRRLMFSRSTPGELVDRFNAALNRLK